MLLLSLDNWATSALKTHWPVYKAASASPRGHGEMDTPEQTKAARGLSKGPETSAAPFSLSPSPQEPTRCSSSPSIHCVQPRPSFSPFCTHSSLSPSQLTVVCRGKECYFWTGSLGPSREIPPSPCLGVYKKNEGASYSPPLTSSYQNAQISF